MNSYTLQEPYSFLSIWTLVDPETTNEVYYTKEEIHDLSIGKGQTEYDHGITEIRDSKGHQYYEYTYTYSTEGVANYVLDQLKTNKVVILDLPDTLRWHYNNFTWKTYGFSYIRIYGGFVKWKAPTVKNVKVKGILLRCKTSTVIYIQDWIEDNYQLYIPQFRIIKGNDRRYVIRLAIKLGMTIDDIESKVRDRIERSLKYKRISATDVELKDKVEEIWLMYKEWFDSVEEIEEK